MLVCYIGLFVVNIVMLMLQICAYLLYIGERGGEWGKQVGSINEESQVRGCYKYNITFICTNQETVSRSFLTKQEEWDNCYSSST